MAPRKNPAAATRGETERAPVRPARLRNYKVINDDDFTEDDIPILARAIKRTIDGMPSWRPKEFYEEIARRSGISPSNLYDP
jgi:hypothetical protein